MVGTQIQEITQAGWEQSFVDDYPLGWTDFSFILPGGGLYGIAFAVAFSLEIINQTLIYAFNATRIETATDTELDLCAQDYFGDQRQRKPGETNAAYRIRILNGLLLEKVTRAGVALVLTQLTGQVPRIIEPWNTGDTGGYDYSYYDVDLPNIPGLYGDTGLQYSFAVITSLPPGNVSGASPIWGFDMGAAYDSYTGVFWQSLSANFLEITDIYKALIATKAAGITVYMRLLGAGLVSWILATTAKLATNLTGGTPTIQPLAGPYCVLLSGAWLSTFWANTFTKTNYKMGFGTPVASGANILNAAVIPFTVPNSGLIQVPGGDVSIPVNRPAGTNLLIATPTWNTRVWISAMTPTVTTLSFSQPAPAGAGLSTYWAPNSGQQIVPPTSIGTTITVPRGVPFVLPSWNTECSTNLTGTSLVVAFSVPAPVGAFVNWSVL